MASNQQPNPDRGIRKKDADRSKNGPEKLAIYSTRSEKPTGPSRTTPTRNYRPGNAPKNQQDAERLELQSRRPD